MKPLSSSTAINLLDRIEYAFNGEVRSVVIDSPSVMSLTISVQDRGREFDWIDIQFEVSGITDARLVDEDKLAYIDMDDGISIVFEKNQAGIAIGKYTTLTNLTNSSLYLLGTNIKFEELNFSG